AWKAHAYAWKATLTNMHPRLDVLLGVAPSSFSSQVELTFKPTPRRAPGSLGVALTLQPTPEPCIGVEHQAYAWKALKHLPSNSKSTYEA
ncbi:hypothetical protein PIB30_094455, partial [Stylosanthes scabra]|nr:hypothetical protein [Stylosanthes scabra]